MLDGKEVLSAVGTTTATILVTLGKVTHAEGDEVFAYYGQTSSLGMESSRTNISAMTRGDVVPIDLTGLSPSAEFHYQFVIQYNGMEYFGDIIKAHTLP